MRNSVAIGSSNIPSTPLDVTGNAIMRNSVRIGAGAVNTAPSAPLDVTGNAKITGDLSMEGTGKIIGLVNPTALQDASTKKYVDDIISYSGSGSLFPTVERADNDNNTHYLTFIPSGDLSTTNGNSKRALLRSDVNGPTYNPSTNILSASQLDLNGNAILRSSVSIGSSNAPSTSLDVTGNAKITGNLDMSSSGRINNLVNPSATQDAATKSYVDTSIPIGGIIMWSGAGVTLPSNWKFCDGSVYSGITTPDLRGRFVLSSGQGSGLINRSVGSAGGVETVTLTEKQMPAHTHGVTAKTGNSAGQATDGAHYHYISGSGSTSQDGLHSHSTGQFIAWSNSQNYAGSQRSNYDQYQDKATSQEGTHSHTVSVSGYAYSSSTGGYDPIHNHAITVGEQTKGETTSHENMPPFYVLAFIMRIS